MITKIEWADNNRSATISAMSNISGKVNTMTLPITPREFELWKKHDLLIQDAFPNLNADQREFLLTGISPEEWDSVFEEEKGEGIDPTRS